MGDPRLVTLEDVRTAREVIGGRVHRTPTMRSAQLSDRLGVDLHLKLELFQKTGSFKVRGALNRMSMLTDGERARGVVTVSAGNHAQAVAWAAREVQTRATVVMPAKAVRSKVEATRAYGGEVILTDADLLETVRTIERERGLVMIPPFDDRAVIAGAGTVGDEIVDDVPDVDVILVGVGGGGIVSGVAVAAKARHPAVRIIGVEPEGAQGMSLSVARGSAQRLDAVNTVADGLAAPWAGTLNFEHVRALGVEMVTVPDSAILDAMWLTMERCKVTGEPAASAGLAALLSGAVEVLNGATVVVIVTGGNIDRDRLRGLA
jgi:threonine dehydratase